MDLQRSEMSENIRRWIRMSQLPNFPSYHCFSISSKSEKWQSERKVANSQWKDTWATVFLIPKTMSPSLIFLLTNVSNEVFLRFSTVILIQLLVIFLVWCSLKWCLPFSVTQSTGAGLQKLMEFQNLSVLATKDIESLVISFCYHNLFIIVQYVPPRLSAILETPDKALLTSLPIYCHVYNTVFEDVGGHEAHGLVAAAKPPRKSQLICKPETDCRTLYDNARNPRPPSRLQII